MLVTVTIFSFNRDVENLTRISLDSFLRCS